MILLCATTYSFCCWMHLLSTMFVYAVDQESSFFLSVLQQKVKQSSSGGPRTIAPDRKRKINNNNNILKTADMLSLCFILLFHSSIFLLFFICIMFWSGSFPSFLLIYPKLNIYLSLLLFDSPLLSSPSSTIPPLHKDWWYATAASNLSKQLYSSGCNIVVYCCSLSFCHFILEYIFFISMQPPWIELHPFVPLLSNLLYIVVLFWY